MLEAIYFWYYIFFMKLRYAAIVLLSILDNQIDTIEFFFWLFFTLRYTFFIEFFFLARKKFCCSYIILLAYWTEISKEIWNIVDLLADTYLYRTSYLYWIFITQSYWKITQRARYPRKFIENVSDLNKKKRIVFRRIVSNLKHLPMN